MKTKKIIKACLSLMAILGFLLLSSPIEAKETLRYSSSAQVMAALGEEVLKQFEEDSGVKVDLFIGSSDVAVYRMMHGVADIASSAERISYSRYSRGRPCNYAFSFITQGRGRNAGFPAPPAVG